MLEDLLSKYEYSENDFSETMYRKMEFYYKLLNTIKSAESPDGISYITKQELSVKMNCSPALIYKTVKILHELDNMVENVGRSMYKVHKTDIIEFGPINRYIKYLIFYKTHPNFMKLNWKEQADAMGIPFHEIQIVYGWIYTGIVEQK